MSHNLDKASLDIFTQTNEQHGEIYFLYKI